MKFQFLSIMHELRSNGVIFKIKEHCSQHKFNFLIVYYKSKYSDLLGCYARLLDAEDESTVVVLLSVGTYLPVKMA